MHPEVDGENEPYYLLAAQATSWLCYRVATKSRTLMWFRRYGEDHQSKFVTLRAD